MILLYTLSLLYFSANSLTIENIVVCDFWSNSFSDHSERGRAIFSLERMFSSLFTCDLYEIFFQLTGQYSANNANMNNNEINEMSLFLGKIKDNTECKIMNAITKQINRLLMVIQYWFIL